MNTKNTPFGGAPLDLAPLARAVDFQIDLLLDNMNELHSLPSAEAFYEKVEESKEILFYAEKDLKNLYSLLPEAGKTMKDFDTPAYRRRKRVAKELGFTEEGLLVFIKGALENAKYVGLDEVMASLNTKESKRDLKHLRQKYRKKFLRAGEEYTIPSALPIYDQETVLCQNDLDPLFRQLLHGVGFLAPCEDLQRIDPVILALYRDTNLSPAAILALVAGVFGLLNAKEGDWSLTPATFGALAWEMAKRPETEESLMTTVNDGTWKPVK